MIPVYIIVVFPDSAKILNLDQQRLYKWAVQWPVGLTQQNRTITFLWNINYTTSSGSLFNDVPIQDVVSHARKGEPSSAL